MLQRRHNDVVDFQVMIPEQLLRQAQRTRDIFNIVLGAIASISLLVGGIGIMNIMLASVMERTKEIGIRRATGATKQAIAVQFLSEATIVSVTGGIIGILLGVGLSLAIETFCGDLDDRHVLLGGALVPHLDLRRHCLRLPPCTACGGKGPGHQSAL